MPSETYRAADFLSAAGELGAQVVVATDHRSTLERVGAGNLRIDLDRPRAAADAIVAHARYHRLDAVVAVDDQGVVVAAMAAESLGLAHNTPGAAAATRDKLALRRAFRQAGVPQPRFGPKPAGVRFPCVVKATGLSASRGVIRADDPAAAADAAARIRSMLGDPQAALLCEEYVPGEEVAVEGLLRGGRLDVLAVFDKPDPLEGPYFEETIYVTPSRLPEATLDRVAELTADAATALGLTEGAVHAELRIDGERIVVLELAARSIGGLCARTLRFGLGVSLENLILRHALGLPIRDLRPPTAASGVMMLPIPTAGLLERVDGQARARAVPGIVGLEITIAAGRPVVPLPEGDRYLGFLFAAGETPQQVEHALRESHAVLDIVIV